MKLLGLMVFLALASYGDDDPANWEIEYDSVIPELHGKQITFNKDMIYMLLNDSNVHQFSSEEIRIGRWLSKKSDLQYDAFPFEDVSDQRMYTIKASYWVRTDWITNAENGDNHFLVLSDENNVLSFIGFPTLYYSSHPELKKYVEVGR